MAGRLNSETQQFEKLGPTTFSDMMLDQLDGQSLIKEKREAIEDVSSIFRAVDDFRIDLSSTEIRAKLKKEMADKKKS